MVFTRGEFSPAMPEFALFVRTCYYFEGYSFSYSSFISEREDQVK